MYNIGLVSLGCAKNQTDAEIMLGILANDGFNITYNPSDADVIIVNTCGFIESAKQESIDAILEMAQYKNGRCRLLIATGCLAERYSADILIELPEVDAIVGTGDYDKIAEVIREAFKGEKPVICGHNDRTPDERLPRILSTPSYTAYLKIADGCDNNCTYCAIPMIRGHFRSRKIEDDFDDRAGQTLDGALRHRPRHDLRGADSLQRAGGDPLRAPPRDGDSRHAGGGGRHGAAQLRAARLPPDPDPFG